MYELLEIINQLWVVREDGSVVFRLASADRYFALQILDNLNDPAFEVAA